MTTTDQHHPTSPPKKSTDETPVEPTEANGASEPASPEAEAAGKAAPPNAQSGVQLIEDDIRVAELTEQVNELEARLRRVSSAYKQLQDEMEQEVSATRERLERRAASEEARRRGEVVSILFEPVQNLRRSVEAMLKSEPGESFCSEQARDDVVKGLQMIVQQFMSAFERLGLEEVPGRGARFDPNLHEAISTQPVTDPALDGIVLEVFSTGYRLGDRLIQPARVVIGAYGEPAGED